MTRSWLALGVTLGAQAQIAFLLAVAPVVAPAVAPMLGFDPAQVGVFTALAFLSAVCTGVVAGPWIDRIGPVRYTACVLLTAAAGAFIATAGGHWLLLAAVLIGAGYGGTNPAAASILGRHAPAEATGFFFSLKQTGVPLGVALAGLTMTAAIAHVGWRTAVCIAASVTIVAALAVLRTARLLEDADRRRDTARSSAWSSLREIVSRPELRRLSLMSLAYNMAQQAFMSYSVSLLVASGLSLTVAGGMLAGSQAASVVMRVGTGHITDTRIEPRRMLAILGFGMALASAGLAAMPQAPHPVLAIALMVFAGATTMGWNGVFFAELVRIVPRTDLAKIASGTQAFTFGGSVLGPWLFYLLLSAGGTYTTGYLLFGAIAAVAAFTMARARLHP